MKVSGAQVTAARNLLRITQEELAAAADVSYRTVLRFEAGQAEPQASSLQKILAELERRGIEFTNGTGMGIRLNYQKAEEFARSTAPGQNKSDR